MLHRQPRVKFSHPTLLPRNFEIDLPRRVMPALLEVDSRSVCRAIVHVKVWLLEKEVNIDQCRVVRRGCGVGGKLINKEMERSEKSGCGGKR